MFKRLFSKQKQRKHEHYPSDIVRNRISRRHVLTKESATYLWKCASSGKPIELDPLILLSVLDLLLLYETKTNGIAEHGVAESLNDLYDRGEFTSVTEEDLMQMKEALEGDCDCE